MHRLQLNSATKFRIRMMSSALSMLYREAYNAQIFMIYTDEDLYPQPIDSIVDVDVLNKATQ